MRSAVIGAISHNKSEVNGVVLLRNYIENITNHVFGDHGQCREYFCKRKQSMETNHFIHLKANTDLYSKIRSYVETLAAQARSLIHDVDSNVVEHFNAKVAKMVGRKRVNLLFEIRMPQDVLLQLSLSTVKNRCMNCINKCTWLVQVKD